mmetsp:Transcript_36459/g.57191  ORF Transcript_36459/g.57191 Transcript_36459/m.57191 type:complete len:199 (-) Transcript_36459:231-827(-)
MAEPIVHPVEDGKYVVIVQAQQKNLTFDEVFTLWKDDEAFRNKWIKLLQDVPMRAYFWECRSFTRTSSHQERFECIFVPSPSLERVYPDRESFASHFDACNSNVASFPNIGNNAYLIVPCPQGNLNFAHIKNFMDQADQNQLHRFWSEVGFHAKDKANQQPLWLSTSGLGVHWLHVRLDQRPKYYTHNPYRAPPGGNY